MEDCISSPNAAQIEFWNGVAGEKWSLYQARLDRAFQPLTKALLAATQLTQDQTIIEIGCGCGDLTLALAACLGAKGKIRACDISKPMLTRAKERALQAGEKLSEKIEFITADAMTHRFEPWADLCVSRFGVMFFDDPLLAFQNIRRGLKPSGRLALLCWCPIEENPWVQTIFESLRGFVPSLRPDLFEKLGANCPEVPGPYAFSDPVKVVQLLSKAGFAQVSFTRVEAMLPLGEAFEQTENPVLAAVEDALPLALNTGPVASLMREADTKVQALIEQKVRECLAAFVKDGTIALSGACWLYQGNVPAT